MELRRALGCGKVAWPIDYKPAPPYKSDCVIWELEREPRFEEVLRLRHWSPTLHDVDYWTMCAIDFVRSHENAMLAEKSRKGLNLDLPPEVTSRGF